MSWHIGRRRLFFASAFTARFRSEELTRPCSGRLYKFRLDVRTGRVSREAGAADDRWKSQHRTHIKIKISLLVMFYTFQKTPDSGGLDM